METLGVFRSFEAERGQRHLGIGGQSRLAVTPSSVSVNVIERDGATLAIFFNTADSPVTASVPVKDGWLAYEPLAERLLDSTGGSVRTAILSVAEASPPTWPALDCPNGRRSRQLQSPSP